MIKSIVDSDTGETVKFYLNSDKKEIMQVLKSYTDLSTCRKKKVDYLNEFMTFDIETTSLGDRGLMYMWGVCIGIDVFIGRTWEQFMQIIECVCHHYDCSDKRMVIYVHNLPFEFQFMRNFFQWNKVFAVDKREPVYAITGGIEFRCSYKLTNMSLAKYCESSKNCVHYKKDGETFDYHKLRFPDTELEDYHYLYQYCDVKGLHEALEESLQDDTLATIPITSTGYVRREARRAMLSNRKNKFTIYDTQLDAFLYLLMRTGRRGGDVAALAQFCDEIMEDVDSWDIKSSYPYVMVTQKFPMSKFTECSRYKNDGRAYLMEVDFYGLRLKSVNHIPYIPSAKCVVKEKWGNCNGRVLYAEHVRTVITDIDYEIIKDVYDYNSMEYVHVFSAKYDMLPKEYREYIMTSFQQKTDLEDGDPYYYGKQKNKTNSLFGMMLTDICQLTHEYEDGEWVTKDEGVEELLHKYYSSENSFLAYQWGLWVTAHARNRLHQPTLGNLGYLFYSDTDSWKCRKGYDRSVFERINEQVIAEAETFDVKPYAIKNGKKVYLGVWSYEGNYEKFKTLGAKKYCYVDHGKLKITVAGLSKTKSLPWLEKAGGIEAFKDGLVFPEGYSGRTFSVYHDVDSVYTETYQGHTYTTGSSLAIHETTYELGKTSEYNMLLKAIKRYGLSNIM